MMILILRSSVVNKLTMTSYKELSLALTIEEPQKHRAPWLGALLSYMAEEVSNDRYVWVWIKKYIVDCFGHPQTSVLNKEI